MNKDELIDIYEKRINCLLSDIDHLRDKFEEACWVELISEKVPEEIKYIEDYFEKVVEESDEERRLLNFVK